MRFLSAIVVLCLAVDVLPAAELGKANFPLEIIQPRPGLDVKNRFYKAYPGLEYNVRLAVIGGVYPFTHELVRAPEGMTIDKDRGEIVWPKPVEAKDAHPVTVTVKVTDQEGKTAEVSWTITVTTKGFLFVDAEKGKTIAEGGTGTFEKPWKTLRDLYGVKEKETEPAGKKYEGQEFHPGEFVYFRKGLYERFKFEGQQGPGATPTWFGGKKPLVWLAYPGESPVLQGALRMNGDHFYADGFKLDLRGTAWHGFIVQGTSHHVTIRRNDFYDLARLIDVTPREVSNLCFIFLAKAQQPGTEFVSIQDNMFHNCQQEGYALLGYGSNKVLVENNRVWDFAKAKNEIWGLSPKASNSRWFIRGNILSDVASSALHSQAANDDPQGHIEFSHNLVFSPSAKALAMDAYSSTPVGDGPLFIYRNTFVGRVAVHHALKDDGPFHFYNNVIVDDNKDGVGGAAKNPAVVIVKDNLVGPPTNKIVDAEGNLTKAFAKYLGTHGHLSKEGKAPPWPAMPKE